MIVRAPRPEGNFYILDKTISEDTRLSWAARGLLVFLLGKPDHWRVSRQALVNETAASAKPAGREAIANLIGELMAAGYCSFKQLRNADGTHGAVEYAISETPQSGQPIAAQPQPPSPAPHAGWPQSANTPLVSIEKKAKTENNNDNARAQVKLSFDNQVGEFKGLREVVLAKWQACFPQVNVPLEIGRAGAWLLANPIHDKKNYQRFLHNWLSRTQDRAASQTRQEAAQAATPQAAPPVGSRPMSRAERGQAAGMALLGIPAEAYLPGAPLWAGQGDVIDITIHTPSDTPPLATPRRAS